MLIEKQSYKNGCRQPIQNRKQVERVCFLGCLVATNSLDPATLNLALQDDDPRLVAAAIRLLERDDLRLRLGATDELSNRLTQSVEGHAHPMVDLQWLLTTASVPELGSVTPLTRIANSIEDSPWVRRALELIKDPESAGVVCQVVIASADSNNSLESFAASVAPRQ